MRHLSWVGLALLATPAVAQRTFDHDRAIAITALPGGLLTEGFPGAPGVAIPLPVLGLVPGDDIDALSFGNDGALVNPHELVFSVDGGTVGFPGTGTAFEVGADTPPGVAPAAAGDLFLQTPPPGNVLAPPGLGYVPGTGTGDESNAAWVTPCGGACDDLDAFDFSPPPAALGVYFSLKVGSPSLGFLGVTPGDVLYSDLTGALPIVAILAGGAGPATDLNLGIAGLELDALNVIGSVGPIGGGGGVIAGGSVGPNVHAPAPPPSTHRLQYSVDLTGGIDADVLVRTGPGAFAIHTPAPALGLMPTENLNALEVRVVPTCPAVSPVGLGFLVAFLGLLGLRRLRRRG